MLLRVVLTSLTCFLLLPLTGLSNFGQQRLYNFKMRQSLIFMKDFSKSEAVLLTVSGNQAPIFI